MQICDSIFSGKSKHQTNGKIMNTAGPLKHKYWHFFFRNLFELDEIFAVFSVYASIAVAVKNILFFYRF